MLAMRENFAADRRRRRAGPAGGRRAGRAASSTTAAAGPVLILLIGAVGFASRPPANTVFDAGVQHDVR